LGNDAGGHHTDLQITVVLGDPRMPDRSKPGGWFTPDDLDQVVRLKTALEAIEGYAFDYWDDHTILLQRLQSDRPAFVLNFCDTGYRNDAGLELHIGAYLEMLGIPSSGSAPVALGLCYDKALVRAVAWTHGVAVPDEIVLAPQEMLGTTRYPVFIKPNRGDGSLGISTKSLAASRDEAEVCLTQLRAQLPGSVVIVQEYLDGKEFSVGLIGNPGDGFDFLPILEVDYSALDPALPRLLDYGSKTDPESPYWNNVHFVSARVPEHSEAQMKKDCMLLFERLGLRDYGRFDFRCDSGGAVKLLEINPNPAWCWDGKLAHMASLRGEDHSDLLANIIGAARRRCFGKLDV